VSLFAKLRAETRLPSFDGATDWLNSEPLTQEGLRGKVVLVDFWTYTCINWLRTLGYVPAHRTTAGARAQPERPARPVMYARARDETDEEALVDQVASRRPEATLVLAAGRPPAGRLLRVLLDTHLVSG
jgi:hypothetical protein